MMRILSCYSTFLCVGNIFYRNSWQLLTAMIHIPLFSKISDHNSRISELTCKHHDGFLFLLPYCFVDTNYSTQIIYITEYQNIILQTSLFRHLSVYFINIYFVVETMTHFNQIISTSFTANRIFWIVYYQIRFYDMCCSSLKAE